MWLEETAPGLLSVSGLAHRAQRTSGSPLAKRQGFHTMVHGHTQCPPSIRYGTSAGVVKLIEGSWSSKCYPPHSNARNSYLLPSRQNVRTHIHQAINNNNSLYITSSCVLTVSFLVIPTMENTRKNKTQKRTKFKALAI